MIKLYTRTFWEKRLISQYQTEYQAKNLVFFKYAVNLVLVITCLVEKLLSYICCHAFFIVIFLNKFYFHYERFEME